MNKLNSIVILVFFVSSLVIADVPTEPAEVASWKIRILQNARKDSEKDASTAIPLLADRILLLDLPWNKNSESLAVKEEIRNLLIAIPGHAEYYLRATEERRAEIEVQNANRVSQGEEPWWNPYDNFRQRAFRVLSGLPSEETVRVLCEMLNDQRDHVPPDQRPKDRNEGRACNLGNAELAVQALNQLRVSSKPGGKKDAPVHDTPLETWRSWYAQVQAGTRKFYLPDGSEQLALSLPSSESVSTEGPRPPRRSGIGAGTPLPKPADSPPEASGAWLAGILAFLGIGAVAIAFRRKSRRTTF